MSCQRDPQAGSPGHGSLGGMLVAVVGPCQDHPQWPGIRGGVERFVSGIPTLQAVCVAPPESTAESLQAAVGEALERGPNAVCLYVADPTGIGSCIELIGSRQALLVTMGRPINDPRVSAHVDINLPGAAELLGANLGRVAAGRRSYLLVHERSRGRLATECYNRFSAAAQRQYELTLLQAVDAAGSGRSPAELVEELLGRFPHAGMIVTLMPDVWLTARPGWRHELRELNRDYRFATLSAAPVLWSRLGTPDNPGEAAALVGPLDGEIGFAAVEIAVRLLLYDEQVPRRHTVSCELVTAASLNDFARRYAAAANGLDVSAYLPAAPVSGPVPGSSTQPLLGKADQGGQKTDQ